VTAWGRMGSSTFQRILDNARHLRTGFFVRYDDTLRELARALSRGGSTNVLEVCTVALYVGGDRKVLDC
jgi:hypothetical protein